MELMATMGVNRRKAIRPPDGSPSNSIHFPHKGRRLCNLRKPLAVRARVFAAATRRGSEPLHCGSSKGGPPLHQGQKFERNFSRDYLVHPTHPISPSTWQRLGRELPDLRPLPSQRQQAALPRQAKLRPEPLATERQRERQPLGDTALE